MLRKAKETCSGLKKEKKSGKNALKKHKRQERSSGVDDKRAELGTREQRSRDEVEAERKRGEYQRMEETTGVERVPLSEVQRTSEGRKVGKTAGDFREKVGKKAGKVGDLG